MMYMKHFIFALALLALPIFVFAEGFVPLTSIPALQEVGNASDLSGFLNGLYRICIGLAATLAILQLVRAGIMYMGGDSVTDKGEARNLILMSLFGLLLVLSPVIVFGIINPNILSLEIDVSGLQSEFAPTPVQQSSQGATALELDNTCTDQSLLNTLQTNLRTGRQNTPTGPLYLTITTQAGVGCCQAVRDTDGSACVGATTQSRVNDRIVQAYTCTCNGGVSNDPNATWSLTQISIRFDLRNVTGAPSSIKDSTPHTMRVNTSTTYPSQAACEAITVSQAQIITNITNNVYLCPSTGGGNCPQRISWVKNQNPFPAEAVLTAGTRTCTQNN
jgi:hypothetical protein